MFDKSAMDKRRLFSALKHIFPKMLGLSGAYSCVPLRHSHTHARTDTHSCHMRYLRSPIGQPRYDLQHKGFGDLQFPLVSSEGFTAWIYMSDT